MANGTGYRFGEFVLNVERACLQRDGQDLGLRPKAFDVLRFLVERAGKLPTKDELIEAAWPNVTVSDDSLAQCVKDIRRLLEDDEQRFIKTVPRRGYMFVAGVETLGDAGNAIANKIADPSPKPRFRLHVGSFAAGLVPSMLLLAAWLMTSSTGASPQEVLPKKYPIFQGNQTMFGQTIAYPSGTPMIRVVDLISQPGDVFDWHMHKTPALGYLLEGEITVDYGSKGTHVLRAGDAFIDALNWPHRGSNTGTTRSRTIAIYLSEEGSDFTVPAAGPK